MSQNGHLNATQGGHASQNGHASQIGRIPIIIDTDPGVDDVIAILLALSSPELDIRAIIVTFGNTVLDDAYLNILKLYQAIYRLFDVNPAARARYSTVVNKKILLARGSDMPLEGPLHSAQYFHGRDGLTGITERHRDLNVPLPPDSSSYPDLIFSDKTGEDVALDILVSEPSRSITYITLGPMTTLARLCRTHGDIVNARIGRVLCMGGALDVPGNTSPTAEFNFFADPFAVHELLFPKAPALGLPIERFLLFPLDTTTPHELPFPYYAAVVDPTFHSTASPSKPEGKDPVVHFTSSFLERSREVMLAFGKDAMELHDIVVIWCATQTPPDREEIGPEDVGKLPVLPNGWSAVHRKFEIERTGELTRGMLVVDRRDDPGAYAPGANRAHVQAELEKHKLHVSGILESTALSAPVQVEVAPDESFIQASSLPAVPVVTTTPGPLALLKLLTKRVWGVEV